MESDHLEEPLRDGGIVTGFILCFGFSLTCADSASSGVCVGPCHAAAAPRLHLSAPHAAAPL